MIIGFTGTRHGMTKSQNDQVKLLVAELAAPPSRCREAHHGDCIGADEEFHAIARRVVGIRIVAHPGNVPAMRAFCRADEVRDPKPFMDRNHDIVTACHVLLATPHEMHEQPRGGTWSTIRMARAERKPVTIVWPDGWIAKERWP